MLYIVKGVVYAAINMNSADDAAHEFIEVVTEAFGDVKPDFGAIQVQSVKDRSIFREVDEQ